MATSSITLASQGGQHDRMWNWQHVIWVLHTSARKTFRSFYIFWSMCTLNMAQKMNIYIIGRLFRQRKFPKFPSGVLRYSRRAISANPQLSIHFCTPGRLMPTKMGSFRSCLNWTLEYRGSLYFPHVTNSTYAQLQKEVREKKPRVFTYSAHSVTRYLIHEWWKCYFRRRSSNPTDDWPVQNPHLLTKNCIIFQVNFKTGDRVGFWHFIMSVQIISLHRQTGSVRPQCCLCGRCEAPSRL